MWRKQYYYMTLLIDNLYKLSHKAVKWYCKTISNWLSVGFKTISLLINFYLVTYGKIYIDQNLIMLLSYLSNNHYN